MTTTLTCDRDARIYSPSSGAGTSDYLPVGLWSGGIYRSLLHFPSPSWTGIRRITSASLRIRTSTQYYVGRGSSPRMLVQRLTQNWSEGSSSVLSSSNAVAYDNQPNSTTSGQKDSGTLTTADSTYVSIDITAIVRAWAPTTVEGGLAQPNYGIRLQSYNEGSTTYTNEFNSRETSYDPQLILTVETNTVPNAPTITAPLTDADGNATLTPLTAGEVLISGTRSDADSGDYLTKVESQVYADTATDAAPGTVLHGQTILYLAKQTTFSIGVPKSALTIGTTYRHRVRTADKADAWGPWTSLANGRFKPDTFPSAPSNLAVDNGATPNLYGSLVDADTGATLSSVRIVVYQDVTGGTIISKWDSGWVATTGTRFAISYGGSPLSVGTRYKFAAQVADNLGAQGPLSDYFYWTVSATVGPDNMTPRTVEAKLNTKPVTLTVGNSSAFDAHLLEVAKYADGSTLLWQPALATYASTSSKAVVYAGLGMDWGRTYYWRAKVRVGGVTFSEWSPWYPFYLNAVPNAPVVTIANGVAATSATGTPVVTVPTLTPTITAPFSDPDVVAGYVDAPSRNEIAITNAATGAHVTGSPFINEMDDANTAVTFNGTSQYVNLGSGPLLAAGDWTVSVFAKPTNLATGWHAFIGGPSGSVVVGFGGTSINAGCVNVADGPASTGFVAVVGTTYHISATYIKSTGALTYYANGALVSSHTFSPAWDTAARQNTIGQREIGGGGYFGGTLDEVAVWTRALTASEVSALYAARRSGYRASVVASVPVSYWRLGEATPGTGTAIDVMGANNGTYVGSPISATGALASIPGTFVVPAGALAWDVAYVVQARYDDNAAQRGNWGQPQPAGTVKPAQAPTVAITAPLNLATVSDPTPTLDWSFTSPGAKAQKRFRVRVYGEGTVVGGPLTTLIYDSGWVTSSVSDHTLPGGLLLTAKSYSWTVDVEDTDSLAASLA